MKVKTTEWMQLTQRNGETIKVKSSSITNFSQSSERFCRVDLGGTILHANETEDEIMKYILEGYTFDV